MISELQFRVPRLLQSNLNLTQRELLKYLGVSFGGVKNCLNALISKGLIKIGNNNKRVYPYLLTPQGNSEKTALTGAFLKRKLQEYQELKKDIETLSHAINSSGAY